MEWVLSLCIVIISLNVKCFKRFPLKSVDTKNVVMWLDSKHINMQFNERRNMGNEQNFDYR